MSKATPISAMLKFHFGSKIFCADGEYGTLTHTVFEPVTRNLSHIGVKVGRFFGKRAVLPFNVVTNATSDGVMLSIKIIDLLAQTEQAAGGDIKGVPLSSKSVVERTGAAGKGSLELVAVHPDSGELAYLVAHRLVAGQDTTLVRAEFVTGLEPEHVSISVPDPVTDALTLYRPDRVLQQEVEAALFDFTPLHVDMKAITARVLDSVLYLDGNISSSLRSDIVVDQALGVPGLLEIKNNLVADDTLAAELAAALGNDPRTRDLPIGVYPRLGVVRLNGSVHNGQQKAAAEEIVRNFPGVRSVINELSVNPQATLLHVMAPAGGNEDIVPNKYTRHTK